MMIFERPYRVLLVDDDNDMANLFSQYLKFRYDNLVSLKHIDNVKEAIDYIEGNNVIHIAFCDIHLGKEEDGWNVLEDITKVERGIQLIALSADKTLTTAIECYNHGARFFVDKPIEKSHLYDVIDRCINHLDYWHEVVHSRLHHRD